MFSKSIGAARQQQLICLCFALNTFEHETKRWTWEERSVFYFYSPVFAPRYIKQLSKCCILYQRTPFFFSEPNWNCWPTDVLLTQVCQILLRTKRGKYIYPYRPVTTLSVMLTCTSWIVSNAGLTREGYCSAMSGLSLSLGFHLWRLIWS